MNMNLRGSNGQLPMSPVEKFEESFQNTLTAITKEDTLTNVDKDEIKVDVEQCLQNFIESARSMEGYFLKKRLHIASQKPELIIKDDSGELRFEVLRKEELVKKNFDKINYWQSILADLQSSTTAGKPGLTLSGPSSGLGTSLPTTSQAQGASGSGPPPTTPLGRPTPPSSLGPGRPTTPGSIGPGGGAHSRLQSPSSIGFPNPISQQSLSSGLQGPLAFLEKTASGIGMNESNR